LPGNDPNDKQLPNWDWDCPACAADHTLMVDSIKGAHKDTSFVCSVISSFMLISFDNARRHKLLLLIRLMHYASPVRNPKPKSFINLWSKCYRANFKWCGHELLSEFLILMHIWSNVFNIWCKIIMVPGTS